MQGMQTQRLLDMDVRQRLTDTYLTNLIKQVYARHADAVNIMYSYTSYCVLYRVSCIPTDNQLYLQTHISPILLSRYMQGM